MPSYSHVTLIGHLGRDTDLKYLQSGTAVANNTLAVTTGYGDKKVTSWYRLTLWNKSAENFNAWTAKGKLVLVSGELSINEYTTNNGELRQSADVNVSAFQVLSPKDGVEQSAADYLPVNTDDIPF